MKVNTAARSAATTETTHEGAPAKRITKMQELERSVSSCLLREREFYEDGESIAARIVRLIHEIPDTYGIAHLAGKARKVMNLRHVPLLIVREMARDKKHQGMVAQALESIIQRPDELGEFLALYWLEKKQPLSKQVKKGLAKAFRKFNEYQLAKYNGGDASVKLRDVLFLCHAKPKDKAQGAIWKRLVNGELKTPDTWEVALSAGKDKKATFTRLIKEGELGALALLRNLRNMQEAGVSVDVIRAGLAAMKTERVLPFRFIAASRYAPTMEPELESAMFRALVDADKMKGTTALLIDVSGSMDEKISAKSDMTRMDAACGLAMLCREICEHVVVFTFSDNLVAVPSRRGFALRDAIVASQAHSSTRLGAAITSLIGRADRLIVFTDEQSHDKVPGPHGITDKGYMVNVASAKNGVGYGPWMHIDGFSESIIRFIQQVES